MSEHIALPASFAMHPIVGFGAHRGGPFKPGTYSNNEAWLTLLFEARCFPITRTFRGESFTLERAELLVSHAWAAGRFGWPGVRAKQFLRAIDDGEIACGRSVLPGWKVHGSTPFILRILNFYASGEGGDGNIKMFLGSARTPRQLGLAASDFYKRQSIPMAIRRAVYERDGHRCLKCGSNRRLSLDHITPVTSGGDNSVDNLQTLCLPCNLKKGSRNEGASL